MTRIKVLVSGRSVSYSGDPHAIKAALITARIPPDRGRFIAPALATEITVTPREERILLAAGAVDPGAGPTLPAKLWTAAAAPTLPAKTVTATVAPTLPTEPTGLGEAAAAAPGP